MKEIMKNQYLIAGLISAITSILVLIITLFTKKFIEKKILSAKLDLEYKFSQRKQIKDVLGYNKVQLNNVCNDLKKRIGNHYRNYENGWMKKGSSSYDEDYYYSFMYRFLAVFAWIELIEKELIFLDSTIANKVDLEYIKFLKLFPRLICSDYLPKYNLEGKESNDHFNRDEIKEIANLIIVQKSIMSYSEFKTELKKETKQFKKICEFFDDINPKEKRVRWDRLYYLQLCLSVFLNQFGYDFQSTPLNKLKFYFITPRYSKNYKDFLILSNDYGLSKNKGIKMIANLIYRQAKTNEKVIGTSRSDRIYYNQEK